MRELDVKITLFFNQFAGDFPNLDYFIYVLSKNNLLKGGVFAAIYLFYWFHKNNREVNRKKIIAGFIACLASMATARMLALTLPMRLRPAYDKSVGMLLPDNLNNNQLELQSSFPSDHAALFFALSAMIFNVNRKAGLLAFIYTVVFIIFPRIYLGLHYVSDILGGLVIGVLMVFLFKHSFFTERTAAAILKFKNNYTGIFYSLFFLFVYQLMDLFEEFRALLRLSFNLVI